VNNNSISLRKFPYPYRAAIALANDIDNTPSLEIFLQMMKLLNSYRQTALGKGLGLEVGSSFWFFNSTKSPQLSYFKGTDSIETDFAISCRELWNSGHIDILHTYGDFDEGGFKRRFAEKSLNELTKYGIKILTWINHGNRKNLQNLGLYDSQSGAVPHHSAYHFDLLKSYGIRYIWSGKMTHVIGQDANKTLNIRVKNFLQTILANLKYRHCEELPFDLQNRLRIKTLLQDGSLMWDFQRFVNAWGREQILDINDLTKQLKPSIVKTLIANAGYLIVYTHMCEGLSDFKQFPSKLYDRLKFISKMYQSGKLLVATTTRLLQYSEVHQNLIWRSHKENQITKIKIMPYIEVLDEKHELSENILEGLTFYCDSLEKVIISFKDKNLKIHRNPKDYLGRYSVSIPWKKLEYPYQ